MEAPSSTVLNDKSTVGRHIKHVVHRLRSPQQVDEKMPRCVGQTGLVAAASEKSASSVSIRRTQETYDEDDNVGDHNAKRGAYTSPNDCRPCSVIVSSVPRLSDIFFVVQIWLTASIFQLHIVRIAS